MVAINTYTLANTLGNGEGKALEIGAKLHAHWLTLEDDSAMRIDFCTGYLVGLYAISPAKAKEWAAMTRKERAEVRVAHKGESATAQRLYNNAESNFNYRVVKNSGRVVKADKTVEPLKLTRAQRAAVQACMDLGITMKVYGQAIALLK